MWLAGNHICGFCLSANQSIVPLSSGLKSRKVWDVKDGLWGGTRRHGSARKEYELLTFRAIHLPGLKAVGYIG